MVAAAVVAGLGWAAAYVYLAHRTREGHRPHGQRAMLVGVGTLAAWLVVATLVGWPVLWGLAALQMALGPWAYAVLAYLWGWDAFPEWRKLTKDSPASRTPGIQLAEEPRTIADEDGRTPPHIDW